MHAMKRKTQNISGTFGTVDQAACWICCGVAARGQFETVRNDLGYGLLLKRYVEDPRAATPEQIKQAVA